MKNKLISRLLVLCLILSLVIALAGCGGRISLAPNSDSPQVENAAEEEVAEDVAEEATTEESKPEEATAEEESKSEEAAAEEATEPEEAATPSEEATAEQTPAEEAQSASAVPAELLGEQTDTSYTNEFFGLTFDAPSTWHILSREDIATIMGLTLSTFDDDSYAELLEDDGYVTDLYAMDTAPAIEGAQAFNNLNMAIQDIGKLYGIMLSEKQIAEASADSVKDALASQGLTDIQTEVGETEFLGKKCVCMTITSKISGIDMYQKQVYLKNGSALAAITASTLGEDKTDEILSAFTAQ